MEHWIDAMVATGGLALLARGAATLAVVAAALVLLRRGGQVVAGLVAAIPVTSAPALAWVGVDRGAAFAAQAGLAALYATGLSAVFTALYAAVALRAGRVPSLLLAAAGTVALCLLTHNFMTDWRLVVPFTLACFGVALSTLRTVQAAPARTGASRRDVAFTAGVSGLLTMLVTWTAGHVPAQWCGLIAAIPVVGISTMVLVHGRWPLANLRAFLRAYVHGLVAKACFVGTLAALLVPLGLAAGWAAALAAAGIAMYGRTVLARPAPTLVHPRFSTHA